MQVKAHVQQCIENAIGSFVKITPKKIIKKNVIMESIGQGDDMIYHIFLFCAAAH